MLATQGVTAAQMPTQIGGFTLDTDMEQYQQLLKAETALPIRFMEGLKEVEIQRMPGFKSGYLAYGTCAKPGKVVRIKLKYDDSSKDFFEKLLQDHKKRFGKPKWLGDPFQAVLTWKWSLEDEQNQVDLYLQHNLSNKEEKFGNSLKLTMLNLMEDELSCFAAKNPNYRQSSSQNTDSEPVEWDNLIPK